MTTLITFFRFGMVALAPLVALIDPSRPARPDGAVRPSVRRAIAVVALLLFLWTGSLFLRLASRTERVIVGGGVPGAGPVATFQVPEVRECYREYLRVGGFEAKKRAMRDFLDPSEVP